MQIEAHDMKAAAIDRFGGVEELTVHTLPVPDVGDDEVLIRVHTAGIGVWDPADREGVFADVTGEKPSFPYVLGSDGAGTVVRVGRDVDDVAEGDRVFAYRGLAPSDGFYAEYAAVAARNVAPVPRGLSLAEAGAMPADAITALCGLSEVLDLKEGETVLIFGASGGVGHLAVQLAKRMGARVLAVASGSDGVALVDSLGADRVVEGHGGDIKAVARELAPEGIDAALILAADENLADVYTTLRDGARVAYPHGVDATASAPEGTDITGYDGRPSPEILAGLRRLVEAGPFVVKIDRAYAMDEVREAHRDLRRHHVGKLALSISSE